MNRSKKSSAITLVFSYLSLSCFLLLANTHNSFITSTHAFDIFNILPTVEPGSNHFLTDIIVGVINRTDIKSIHVNLTDLSIDGNNI